MSLVAAALLAGCGHPPPDTDPPADTPPVYRLGPGDRVRVTVFQREDLSGEFEVDSSGRIALPLVRGVSAAGLTLPGLEEAVIERLARERLGDPKVSVDLLRSRPVCILGEVVNPGCYDYFYGMRAAAAIAKAGGYTYRAHKNVVEITREGGDKLTGGHETLVYPGDVIEVGDRLF